MKGIDGGKVISRAGDKKVESIIGDSDARHQTYHPKGSHTLRFPRNMVTKSRPVR